MKLEFRIKPTSDGRYIVQKPFLRLFWKCALFDIGYEAGLVPRLFSLERCAMAALEEHVMNLAIAERKPRYITFSMEFAVALAERSEG